MRTSSGDSTLRNQPGTGERRQYGVVDLLRLRMEGRIRTIAAKHGPTSVEFAPSFAEPGPTLIGVAPAISARSLAISRAMLVEVGPSSNFVRCRPKVGRPPPGSGWPAISELIPLCLSIILTERGTRPCMFSECRPMCLPVGRDSGARSAEFGPNPGQK